MKIGTRVQYAIEDAMAGRMDAALLHAVCALDGTAARTAGLPSGVKRRFCAFIDQRHDVIETFMGRGINLTETRWPVSGEKSGITFAELVYRFHRNVLAHGDEIEPGYELLECASLKWPHLEL